MPTEGKFANNAYISVTESAANTLTYGELETGVSTFEKVGWIIHRLEYWMDNTTLAQFGAASDSLMIALCLSNSATTLALSNANVVDLIKMNVMTMGAPATALEFVSPVIRDFSNLPGGGKIIPPRPLYLAVEAGGFATPAEVSARFIYSPITLKADEYWDLVEAYRLIQ